MIRFLNLALILHLPKVCILVFTETCQFAGMFSKNCGVSYQIYPVPCKPEFVILKLVSKF